MAAAVGTVGGGGWVKRVSVLVYSVYGSSIRPPLKFVLNVKKWEKVGERKVTRRVGYVCVWF